MKRVEVAIEKTTKRPVVYVYKNETSTKPSPILRGINAINYIKKFYKKEISDVFELEALDNVLIRYKDSILEINRYSILLTDENLNKLFKPIINPIGNFLFLKLLFRLLIRKELSYY